MRRMLPLVVCAVALLALVGSAPTVSPAAEASKVPVFVSLENGKIVVEPETLRVYWGTTIVFEVEAEARELVELEFERSPFKADRKYAWFGTRGPAKVPTGPAIRLDAPARDPSRIGRQKPAEQFKYTVSWSGGRAPQKAQLDPIIIIIDNGE